MSDLIDAFGGTQRLADEIRLNRSTVANWRKRGIPWRYRPTIAALATQRRIDLPRDFLHPTGRGA